MGCVFEKRAVAKRLTGRGFELPVFFLLSFLISWLIWLPGVLDARGILDTGIAATTLQHMGGYGPTLAVIFTIVLFPGGRSLVPFLKSSFRFRFSPVWYAVSVVTVPAVMGASYLFARFVWNVETELPLVEQPALVFIFLPYILFLGGPLGEELGWRGFALPRLLRRLSPFWAAVILGIIWTCWHLPHFFMEGTVQSLVPFYGYAVITVYNSIFITLVYRRSGRSVVSAMLFHLFSNFSYSLFPIFTDFYGQLSLLIVYSAATLALCIRFRVFFFRKVDTPKDVP
jgi:uncharacterized protein